MEKLCFLTIFAFLVFFSCAKEQSDNKDIRFLDIDVADGASSLSTEALRRLAESDDLINLSLDDIKRFHEEYSSNKGVSADTLNLIKTIIYRIYSHVEVRDRALELSIKTGKEIGLREEVFQEYLQGIEQLNKDLSKKNAFTASLTDEALKNSIRAQLEKFPD